MAGEERQDVQQPAFPAPFVSVIIPAHNEADRIAPTIAALKRAAERSGWAWELIVVDDASDDDTATVAAQAGATKVFRLSRPSSLVPRPFGKGAALRRGIAEAKGDIVLFVDADIGDDAEKFWTLVEWVRRGDADMAIAAPPPT
jgi:Glycosyltransferases involved in cell wall biogenesis